MKRSEKIMFRNTFLTLAASASSSIDCEGIVNESMKNVLLDKKLICEIKAKHGTSRRRSFALKSAQNENL